MKTKAPRFGRVELRIMDVLWKRGRANARDITDRLNRGDPIAHGPVQTLLRDLEKKNAVAHDIDDRTFVYRPLVEREQVKRQSLKELAERLFDGSAGGMIAYLLKNEKLTREQIDEIRALIPKKES